jgi:hypothetical protein
VGGERASLTGACREITGAVLSTRNPGRGSAGVSEKDDPGFGGRWDRPAESNGTARSAVPGSRSHAGISNTSGSETRFKL